MAKIYLVRHGESIANTKGIYQGQTYNTSLSKLGLKQAKKLNNFFEKVEVDEVYSSPLKRTLETSNNAFSKLGYKINQEQLIIETNHGQWEGLKKEVVMKRWPNEYKTWLNSPKFAVFPSGETFENTVRRTLIWWTKIASKKRNVVAITHDNIIRIILSFVLGQDMNSIWQHNLQPASVSVVEIDQIQKQKVIKTGDVKHLGDLLADLSKHAL